MASSIISIDWLQIYADVSLLKYSDEYEAKILDYGTKNFEILEEVYLQGSLFCSVQRKPRSEIIKSHTAVIKFENSLLYFADAETIIATFLRECEIHLLSITRIDLAVDFKKFKNGLLPQSLIKGFMKEKFLKNGRGKYTLIGSQKNVLDVSYLRFGAKSSDVNVYLYNKSLEMKEKVYKPYIAERWKQLEGSPLQDVWRLEFSLTAKATTFIDEQTGEIQTITLNTFSNTKQQKEIISALEKRYFEFKVNDGQKNKTRMKRLLLLDLEQTTFTNRYLPAGSDIYKRDKILMKNLYTLDKEHRDIPNYLIEAKTDLIDFMTQNQTLKEYYDDKVLQWDRTVFR